MNENYGKCISDSEIIDKNNAFTSELMSSKDKYGNTFFHLWCIDSGVDNNADAKKLRRIAKKHGYKCRLEMAYRLRINFIKL